MNQNLGRTVKWQDDDSGWHIGRVVLGPYRAEMQTIASGKWVTLVKESNCGTLSWAESDRLSNWPDVKYCSRCLRPLTSEGSCKEADKCICNEPVNKSALTYQGACQVPQPKVTRDEVIRACIEQIKEEEEGLLTLNKQLQEAYEDQVVLNQIERNYQE